MPAIDFDHLALDREIRSNVDSVFGETPELAEFVRDLSREGRVVVFGGFVRDCIHNFVHKEKVHPKDLDLVVDGSLTGTVGNLQNSFGGQRRWFGTSLKIDFWELSKTYAFSLRIFPPVLAKLPLTTVYRVNSCYFDLTDQNLVENGAVKDISAKLIAFNCIDYLKKFPQYQAFRAIELAHRLQYELHEQVSDFVKLQIRESTIDGFVGAVQDHRPYITRREIEALCNRYS